MGWLRRIAVIAVLGCLWGASAHASIDGTKYWRSLSCSSSLKRATKETYCPALGAWVTYNPANPNVCSRVSDGTSYCGELEENTCAPGTLFSNTTGTCASRGTAPANTSWNAVTGTWDCSSGYVLTGGVCVAPDCGELGQEYDSGSGTCEWPDTPPTCGSNEMATVNASGATVACTPMADIPDTCDYSLGYDANGYFICGDAEAECTAKGGTAGYVDGETVCIPGGYSPPICDSTQKVMLSGGGFVCSSPAVAKPQNPDEVVDPSEGAAPPGETSTTPSGQSAAPGTGTTGGGSGGTGTPGAPAIEADEGTREEGKTGEGRASADCSSPPVCSGGDPQVCALLRQQWETMCAQPDMLERVDGNQAQVIVDALGRTVDSVFAEQTPASVIGTVAADATGGVGSSAEMGWFDGFVADLIPSGTSCTSYSMNMPRVVLTFGCERLDWLKSFLGWMLYCYTVFFVWGTVFAPYRAPAGGE